MGFSSFHFRFVPSDKRTFCHSSLATLDPAPLLPLDDNVSIAWSMRVRVQYIRSNTWPGKLQSSLLGYFPGLYETATGDTDAPSRHSCAAHSLLLLSSLSPHLASAPRRSSSIASCIRQFRLSVSDPDLLGMRERGRARRSAAISSIVPSLPAPKASTFFHALSSFNWGEFGQGDSVHIPSIRIVVRARWGVYLGGDSSLT